jgi:hypothetical protein
MGFLLRVIVILIVVSAFAWGALSFYYGSPDPCRMLASEKADQTNEAAKETLGVDAEDAVESVMRLGTSQMTTQDCAKELYEAWAEKLFGSSE